MKKHHILYLLALIVALIVGGSLLYKPNENISAEQNNLKVGNIVDGWKVIKSIKEERLDGTFYDEYIGGLG